MIRVTRDGRQRPVCDSCGKVGQVKTTPGRFTPWDLARGWSCTPYAEDYQHRDGSTGTLFECAACSRLDSVQSIADGPRLRIVTDDDQPTR